MFVPRTNGPPKIIMNTLLGGAAAGLTTMWKGPIMGNRSKINKYDVASMCNGILVGLVGVTANCD